ncbi:MAG: DNA-directed DNA polymerase alpha subunit pol12 [Trizodia sp. TS-e1964]|nr:MAG: DNA-directed DNA polymerase alpha subunit pol12 [Trizodia sp. TS-e1964]
MEDSTQEINRLFALPPLTELPPDVMRELQSILRLHSITAQELFYKWESYSMKMGPEVLILSLESARALKNDVQENLEKENRGKSQIRGAEKRSVTGTPRNIPREDDILGMLGNLLPNTPRLGSHGGKKGSTIKRKAFETPLISRSKNDLLSSSPSHFKTPQSLGDSLSTPIKSLVFSERRNAGQTIETLNDHLIIPEALIAPFPEARVKLVSFSDTKKYSYRPMAMHLSEASEVLDDRIDEFLLSVQAHYSFDDASFGNPASQSTNEIVAVGRIASDSLEGQLNIASLVLETSRRMGAGLRVPLKLDSIPVYEFFPGQIVALKGVNASGEYFSVSEILTMPLLPPAASNTKALQAHHDRLHGGPDAMEEDTPRPLNVLIASGPYTPDDNLDFESLNTLCEQAATNYVDALILTGPFLDLEHPLIASGDFDLPLNSNEDPDTVNMNTLFRYFISAPFRRLAELNPTATIILIPSVRDLINKHVSWPQDLISRKELGLPKQAKMVTNPVTLSLNELVIGISSQDILWELSQQEAKSGKPKEPNRLARLPRYLIEQRHFFPLFPPAPPENLVKTGGLTIGAMLDTSYLKLGEWPSLRPDVLITPSVLPAFAKFIEGVLVVNPGNLSKQRGSGTYAQLTIHPPKIPEAADEEMIPHKLYERGRVDVIKI